MGLIGSEIDFHSVKSVSFILSHSPAYEAHILINSQTLFVRLISNDEHGL